MSAEPRIQFKKFKGFPELDFNGNARVPTHEFLIASKEVVTAIESFGRLFVPVTKDMQGNVDKLTKCFLKNPIKYEFLDSLILENKEDQVFSSDALLWLKRALELIHKFFENILNDVNVSENLKDHLQAAYDITLKQYHGWIVQNTVTLIYRWVPNRSELLGNGDPHQENLMALRAYLPVMGSHLKYIDSFLKEHNLAQVKD